MFTSADPNLFGSRKRRKAKEKLADQVREQAVETEADIQELQTRDPFQSAAAKSALKTASQQAKQQQQRALNVLGTGASPEAIVAATGKAQAGIGEAAGEIATGAEATKAAQLQQLEARKAGQQTQATQIQQSAVDEIGSGWRDFYATFFNPLAGGIKGGAQAASQ